MASKATKGKSSVEKKYLVVTEATEENPEVRDIVFDSIEEAADYCLGLCSGRTLSIFEAVVVGYVKPLFVPLV